MADSVMKGITVNVGGDTTGLSEALKNVNSEASSISKELKEVEKALKLNPESAELAAQKLELLGKQSQNAAERVKILEDAQKQFNDKVASGEIEKGTTEYRSFERQVETAKGQLEKASSAQKEFGDSTKKSSVSMDDLKNAMSKVGDVAGTLASGFAAVTAAAVAIGTAAIAGVAQAATAFADLNTQAYSTADSFATMATQTGVSVETLQAYDAVSELVDVSTESLTASMQKNFKSMQSAQDGSDKAVAAYEALGVAVTDADGNLRDSESVYWEVIDALGNVADETERNALANDLFGNSYQNIVPLIETGSEALGEMMQTAIDTGKVMSEDTVDALLRTSDAYENLSSGLEAVKNNIGAMGAEMFAGVYEGAGQVVDTFNVMIQTIASGGEVTEEMKQQMVDGVKMMADSVKTNLPKLLEAFKEIIGALADVIPEVLPVIVDAAGEIIPEILATLVDLLPLVVDAGVQLFTALVEAMPTIIEMIVEVLPGLIDAIIAALLDALPLLIECGITLFCAICEAMPQIINAIVARLPEIFNAIVSAFAAHKNDLMQAGVDLIKGLWNGIESVTDWIWSQLSGFCSGIVGKVKDFFGIKSPSRVFRDEVGKFLAQGLAEGFTDEMDKVSTDMMKSVPTDFSLEANAALGLGNGSVSTYDLTIPLTVDGEKLTSVISRIQFNRYNNTARVAGVL